MDPNETIAQLRNLSRGAMRGNPIDCMALAEAFHHLDSWLSNGGFLPRVWENYR